MLDEELKAIIASRDERGHPGGRERLRRHMDGVFGGQRREIQLLIEHIERSLKALSLEAGDYAMSADFKKIASVAES